MFVYYKSIVCAFIINLSCVRVCECVYVCLFVCTSVKNRHFESMSVILDWHF